MTTLFKKRIAAPNYSNTLILLTGAGVLRALLGPQFDAILTVFMLLKALTLIPKPLVLFLAAQNTLSHQLDTKKHTNQPKFDALTEKTALQQCFPEIFPLPSGREHDAGVLTLNKTLIVIRIDQKHPQKTPLSKQEKRHHEVALQILKNTPTPNSFKINWHQKLPKIMTTSSNCKALLKRNPQQSAFLPLGLKNPEHLSIILSTVPQSEAFRLISGLIYSAIEMVEWAHAQGVSLNDVGPHNIALNPYDGRLYITDIDRAVAVHIQSETGLSSLDANTLQANDYLMMNGTVLYLLNAFWNAHCVRSTTPQTKNIANLMDKLTAIAEPNSTHDLLTKKELLTYNALSAANFSPEEIATVLKRPTTQDAIKTIYQTQAGAIQEDDD